MATTLQRADRPGSKLPKHGPTYTFYLFTALAVLVAAATYIGLRLAAAPHWF